MLANKGSWNGFTTLTSTTFNFECTNAAFEGGLDRFSQMFIDPQFQEDCVIGALAL